MARVKFSEVEKRPMAKSSWLRLKNNGDSAFVQFFYNSIDEFPTFTVHKAMVNENDRFERSIDCLRNPGEPLTACPLCAKHYPTYTETYAVLYNHSVGELQIWKMSKSFITQLKNFIARTDKFNQKVFELVRNGAAGSKETTYTLFPADGKDPIDLSQFEEPERFGIENKTFAEMEHFAITGSWDMTTAVQSRQVEAKPADDWDSLGKTTLQGNEKPWDDIPKRKSVDAF